MSATVQELSQNMASLVEQAGPQIVRVEARRRLPATGVIYRADGLIVTSNHVVERDDNITIGLSDGGPGDGTSHNATLVGRDPNTDLALLRVNASDLPAAGWNSASDLRVGHLVLALGRPGKTVQATLGIISALGGGWRTPAGADIEQYLQTDVAMYPGFSGGPLLTGDGKFAGLNSSALLRGISVTIPAATITRVVDTLLAHGRVPRGYLGVGIQPVRLAGDLHEGSGQETGLMIMSVEADSPAAQSGLLQGDVLVAVDGQPVRHVDDLQARLSGNQIGKQVSVKLVRSGQFHDFTVVVGQSQ